MSIAEIDCDTGFYNKNDNQTSDISTTNIKCSASGKWINMPTCVLKDCGKLSSPSNGIISYVSNMTTFASKAVYICDNGYQLNGSDTIECKNTGKWSDYTTYCQIKDCGVVLPPANGDIVLHQNSTVYGSNATYICDEGYNMIGQANITCEASGNWDNKTTSCKIKDCDSPEGPTDGNATAVNGTTYLSIAKYVCNEGFDLNGSDTRICQANGSWSGRVPTCEIKNCGAIQNPTNGKVNTENGTEYKSVATFICETGYTLIGDNMTSCEPSGNWSIYSLNCTINDCGHPTKPMNGSVEISNGTTYQSLVTFKCDVGFEMNGTNTSECQANSKWSNEVPQCIIKDCGPRTKPINGSIEISNGTTYQSLMAFKCDVGFEMNGTNTSECQANSRWSNEVPKCNIKDCGDPKWPNQGKILSKTGNKYNDNVTYSCNQGYETSDPVLVTCNSSGNWSRPAPVCKDINECTRYTNDCHLQAICNNTDGSYKCQCREGFTDNSTNGQHGRDCQDINECADLKKIQCDKDRSRCVNYLGGHVCFCHQGWTGLHCENDIDECNDTSSCGVEAYCTNFYGGYNCTCKKNFPKGDPTFHCYENVIIELVTPVAPFRGDNELITSFPIHNRFPYFGTEYKSFRPNMNGFITLGFQPLYQNYGPETPTDWKTFSEGRTVIAPFWTNLDSTNLTGGVFVHLMEYYSGDMNDSRHKDLAMLGEIFSNNLNLTDFNPRVAIEATWLNVTKSSYIIPTRLIKSQNVTMQLILISDGIYSYLMFNYDHEQWSLKLDKNIPSSAGFSCKDNNVHILATSKNASSLNNDTNVQSGPNGRWIFDVTDDDPDKIAVLKNESECLKFSKNDKIRKWIARQRLLSYACPCVQQQMDLDYSYHIVEPMYEHSSPKPTCYEAWFFNNDGVKQTCCYSYGALKKDFTGGGFATFKPDTYNIIQYFYMCCDPNTDRHLCHLFYEMNPPDDCSRFQPADEPVSRHKRSLFGFWINGAGKLYLNVLYIIVLLLSVQIIN
ncbi:sushi, von Willebrand factor type A, EGF and pentraxin domain-containing protein 1-like [Ruditapes philippinarum]|uniref:sushi, von Willebrand factor type A, EGF and pentraxin domain-containing protein 1-like n=1 Tax=Ruditapes philippinarum TaxID=129788 RepID=UPI00295B1DC6|nr:sushi, von Willebrand factor type A, EGF and pentraxin domain-containing protein 1-like [Ruditapes philippinarum]